MNMRLLPILVVLFLISSGCGTISVQSSPPQSNVSVILPNKEKPKLLGTTPYTAALGDLEDMVNEGTIVIVVAKRGYIAQQFVVPNLGGGDLRIQTNLLPNLPSNYNEINRIVSLVLRAERMLLQKRYGDALKISSQIKKLNENVATAFEIEGTVHFLKNELKQSRFAWIRVLELEPNNPEAQSMLAKIEKKLGMN